jgi:hypothetical protein
MKEDAYAISFTLANDKLTILGMPLPHRASTISRSQFTTFPTPANSRRDILFWKRTHAAGNEVPD